MRQPGRKVLSPILAHHLTENPLPWDVAPGVQRVMFPSSAVRRVLLGSYSLGASPPKRVPPRDHFGQSNLCGVFIAHCVEM
eukprot:7870846-Alexandrium_andersonii.AAC.1